MMQEREMHPLGTTTWCCFWVDGLIRVFCKLDEGTTVTVMENGAKHNIHSVVAGTWN